MDLVLQSDVALNLPVVLNGRKKVSFDFTWAERGMVGATKSFRDFFFLAHLKD